MNVRTYKGTRDFLPEQMVKRQFVINKIQNIFEKFGFEPLETPAMELMETLGGKYGEEGDKLLYNFTDRGNRQVGLRYDLTVPLSRVIAMHHHLVKPFKRYQVQPVWRADKPQKGRFREFYQCDVDIVGSNSLLADAEIVGVLIRTFKELGFSSIVTKINNRKILRGMIEAAGLTKKDELDVIRIIDKMDKIGFEGIKTELYNSGINEKCISDLLSFLSFEGTNRETIAHAEKFLQNSKEGMAGLDEIKKLIGFLNHSGISEDHYKFDLFLARGLDYYTGPIFESIIKEVQIGSVAGGGRYDKLIGLFKGEDIPAVGVSIGLERIITVMEELNMFPAYLKTPIDVLITVFNNSTINYSLGLANKLRMLDFNVDLFLGKPKLRPQLGYAADKGIPLVVIAGPDEIEEKKVTVKNMLKGEQFQISETELPEKLKTLLTDLHKE